jgi:hypothetical protein
MTLNPDHAPRPRNPATDAVIRHVAGVTAALQAARELREHGERMRALVAARAALNVGSPVLVPGHGGYLVGHVVTIYSVTPGDLLYTVRTPGMLRAYPYRADELTPLDA